MKYVCPGCTLEPREHQRLYVVDMEKRFYLLLRDIYSPLEVMEVIYG
jgi:hypothetical protein